MEQGLNADSMLAAVEGEDPGLAEGLHYRFYYRRRLLEPSEQMVRLIMDGGETVYAKVRTFCGLSKTYC